MLVVLFGAHFPPGNRASLASGGHTRKMMLKALLVENAREAAPALDVNPHKRMITVRSLAIHGLGLPNGSS